MITQRHEVQDEKLAVEGYVRGNHLSTRRIIHVTGYGDFKVEEMMFPPDPCPTAHRKHPETNLPLEEGVDPNLLENSNAFGAEQTWPTEDELKNNMVADEYKDMDMDEPEPTEAEVGPVAPGSSQEPTTDDGLGGLTQ